MSKTTSIIIAILILGSAYWFVREPASKTTTSASKPSTNQVVENTQIKDGVQYVTVTARSGYSPRMSVAKAGIPTKLVMKTDGTYDCSSSLVIKSLNYRNILPNTGETEIAIGTPKAGDVLQGVCGMGMYSFTIDFRG